MYDTYRNIEKGIYIIKSYDGKTWKRKAMVIGCNTPLSRYIAMLIKMNRINFEQRKNNNESNTKWI